MGWSPLGWLASVFVVFVTAVGKSVVSRFKWLVVNIADEDFQRRQQWLHSSWWSKQHALDQRAPPSARIVKGAPQRSLHAYRHDRKENKKNAQLVSRGKMRNGIQSSRPCGANSEHMAYV